ncbi:Histone-lysine N-methyltransferase 2A [Acipenser ruthenus]|uniref:[histone H3]-lysine(4) N-methyltransferase n=1 Tax=Acipenser ruthenus TaxID=7906 RepID=A0A444UDE7_ACIRT|nr:Histone-lysine N-methyltransferase 2A [Acipenser ruthenus]
MEIDQKNERERGTGSGQGSYCLPGRRATTNSTDCREEKRKVKDLQTPEMEGTGGFSSPLLALLEQERRRKESLSDRKSRKGLMFEICSDDGFQICSESIEAEVFEDDDGSLKNVHMAVIRGKQLRCEHCQRPGATVGCCLTSCTSNYHFMCARLKHCVFLEDKKVYCQRHRDLVKGECYDDDDYESKMMQCGKCDRWVHSKCENLTDEMYEILSNLPENIAYTCINCTDQHPAEWRTALGKELQGSVRLVLTALLNSRTTTHLLRYRQEDCDVENVWEMGGLSILTSVPITPRVVCLLCASSGHVEFVYCQVCCEPFHLFCLEESERPLEEQWENWCCRRCKFCHVCGRLHQATKICTKCVHCKSCGATTPGKSWDAQWSHDFSLCHDCAKLFAKGEVSPKPNGSAPVQSHCRVQAAAKGQSVPLSVLVPSLSILVITVIKKEREERWKEKRHRREAQGDRAPSQREKTETTDAAAILNVTSAGSLTASCSTQRAPPPPVDQRLEIRCKAKEKRFDDELDEIILVGCQVTHSCLK